PTSKARDHSLLHQAVCPSSSSVPRHASSKCPRYHWIILVSLFPAVRGALPTCSDQPLSICQEIQSTEVSHESMARATIRIPRSKFAYGMLVEFVGFRSSGQLHLLKPSV